MDVVRPRPGRHAFGILSKNELIPDETDAGMQRAGLCRDSLYHLYDEEILKTPWPIRLVAFAPRDSPGNSAKRCFDGETNRIKMQEIMAANWVMKKSLP